MLGERDDVVGQLDRMPDRQGARPGLGSELRVGLGGFAGLDRDHVGGECADLQRGGDPGDDVVVGHAAVQHQHVDQRAGAGRVTVRAPHRGPSSVMDRGELSSRPRLLQRRRARQPNHWHQSTRAVPGLTELVRTGRAVQVSRRYSEDLIESCDEGTYATGAR